MKIDMHCHVKEGSIDSKVSLDEYITILKSKGFQGMVVTDHNTYKGYRHWKYHMKGKAPARKNPAQSPARIRPPAAPIISGM